MISPYHTLITGASRGLGRALALECARRRMNLILVSLPGEWLHDLAASIRVTYRVEVIAIEMDLCGEGVCERLFRIVSNREIKIHMLINNMEQANPCRDTNDRDAGERLRCSELATAELTHRFLPMLRENGPSYILNRKPIRENPEGMKDRHPSFLGAMTYRLRRELRGSNIHVSLLCPGQMKSGETNNPCREKLHRPARFSAINTEQLASLAIDGLLRRSARIYPGCRQRVMAFLERYVPANEIKMGRRKLHPFQ